MNISRLKKIASGSTGSEIAEAALVLPIFFMLMLGIYWFGRAFNVYATINHAAREGPPELRSHRAARPVQAPAIPIAPLASLTPNQDCGPKLASRCKLRASTRRRFNQSSPLVPRAEVSGLRFVKPRVRDLR